MVAAKIPVLERIGVQTLERLSRDTRAATTEATGSIHLLDDTERAAIPSLPT